jgi:RNA polymerase sigma-70 factor (ECF subfamily)
MKDFSLAFQQHERWLRTVLYARIQDRSAVEDLLQEVWIKLFKHRASLDVPDGLAPWLYRVALREVLMHRRKLGRRKERWRQHAESCGVTADASGTDPLAWMIDEELRDTVHEALQRVAAQDREILLLKHWESYTYQQIAERLGLPLDTVVYRLARARRRLRAEILTCQRSVIEP